MTQKQKHFFKTLTPQNIWKILLITFSTFSYLISYFIYKKKRTIINDKTIWLKKKTWKKKAILSLKKDWKVNLKGCGEGKILMRLKMQRLKIEFKYKFDWHLFENSIFKTEFSNVLDFPSPQYTKIVVRESPESLKIQSLRLNFQTFLTFPLHYLCRLTFQSFVLREQ